MPLFRRLLVALLVVWASTVASAAPIHREHVTCRDGDSCDLDRTANGVCRLSVCYLPDAGVFRAPCPTSDGSTSNLFEDVVVPLRDHGRRHGRAIRHVGAGANRTALVVRCQPSPTALLPQGLS